jgi:eukaryotic-like serine/threonine-protein kinase
MLQEGATFHDRYRVVRCIKSGGMGTVYEVIDSRTERARALKTMLPHIVADPGLRARFISEAKVTAPIKSQHIVEVFDAGVDEASGLPFLVMEMLEGEDLGALLQKRGRLSATETLALLYQLALALERTHEAGIVHRDLKPDNLFVTASDDGSPHLKVLDFGIAKVLAESGKARTTLNLGTPLYMSPEQVRGDGRIDRRADLYSVGQIAFAMLTGKAFFEREASQVSSAQGLLLVVVGGTPEAATARAAAYGVTLPTAFDAWYARATQVDAQRRFDNAREMIAALATALGAPLPCGGLASVPTPVVGDTLPSTRPDDAKGSRWSRATSLLLLLVLTAFGVGATWLRRVDRTSPPTELPPMPRRSSVEPVNTPPLPEPSIQIAAPSVSVTAGPNPTIRTEPGSRSPTSRANPNVKPARPTQPRAAAPEPPDPTEYRRLDAPNAGSAFALGQSWV